MTDSQVASTGTNRKITVALIVLALPSLLATEKLCTPGVTYLDPVTGHCDPCSDICELAREQGTLVRCEKLCQGYQRRNCPQNHYYDKRDKKCEPCTSVCLHPTPGADCRKYCSEWVTPVVPSSTRFDEQNITVRTNTSTMAVYGGKSSEGGDKHETTTWFYVALIGVGTLLVCSIAMLTVLLWKPCTKKLKALSQIGRCRKRPYQEQDSSYTMLPARPIVRSGRGPFGTPTEDV